MSTTVVERAHALRKEHSEVGARTRLVWARHAEGLRKFDWTTGSNGLPETSFEEGPFVLRVWFEWDEYGADDSDCCGTFSDYPETDYSIKHERGWSTDYSHKTYDYLPWFNPAFDPREDAKAYNKAGVAKGPAWERAMKHVRNAYELASDDNRMIYVLRCEATFNGAVVAEAALGGMEYDLHTDAHADGMVADSSVVEEVLIEANEWMENSRHLLLDIVGSMV